MGLGDVPYRLLKVIETSGSLNRATAEVGISYRAGWLALDRFEGKVGLKLIEKRVGGGSRLTASGRDFIVRYEQFRTEVSEVFAVLFDKHFA